MIDVDNYKLVQLENEDTQLYLNWSDKAILLNCLEWLTEKIVNAS